MKNKQRRSDRKMSGKTAVSFLVLLSLTAAVFSFSGCSSQSASQEPADSGDLIVVGFSQVGAESDWRNANTRSMQEALSSENGYRLILDDAQQKQEKQITAIRNFINQGVDYIVLAPTRETGWDTVLTEAKHAGIPVIIVDRMIETSDQDLFTCWVGSDFRSEGDKAVKWLEDHMKDTPLRIAHLQGSIGSSAQIGRTSGLDAGIGAHDNWSLVFRESGDFTQAKGQEMTEKLLSSDSGFDVLYSENDNMTYGAIEALESAGIEPGRDVTILSFDASSKALHLILDGKINYDVECNPLHGPRVRKIIEQLEQNETPLKYTYVEEVSFDSTNLLESVIEGRGY